MTRKPTPAFVAAYPPNLAWDYAPPTQPLGALLRDTAQTYPARTALHFLGRNVTYQTLHTHAQTLAAHLQGVGVSKGDKVALCLPNCPAAVAAYFAIVQVGAVVVNTNPLYTADELTHILADSGAKVIITTNLTVSWPKLENHITHKGIKAVMVNFAHEMPWHLGVLFRLFKRADIATVKPHANISWLHTVLAQPATPKPSKVKLNDLAVIQYTGGTTGTPKGAMLSHGAIAHNVRQIQLWLGNVPEGGDRVLAILPLFHVFAMTVAMNLTIANGGRIVLLPKFDLQQVLTTLRKQRITLLPGVPTLFNALANASNVQPAWFESLRYGISGGAPLPPEVKDRFETLTQSRLMEGYGLTESSPVAACNPRHKPSKTGSAGLPLPRTLIRIQNPDKPKAKPCKVGEVGEVWVQGPQLMNGYWNNPKATRACLTPDGWLRTGDLGFIDSEGYVHLTDRMKDIILVNGYNVYPRVIEDALYTHPAVAEVMVIGLPHPHKGEAPHAYVVLKPNATTTPEALLAYAKTKLNPLERPVGVVVRAQLPKTQVGKLSKKDLKAEVLKG